MLEKRGKMSPLQARNPQLVEEQAGTTVPPLPVATPVEVAAISARLAKGAELIRAEWPKVEQGAPRENFDKLMLLWLDVMQDYYHAGGTGCALAPAGRQCSTKWDSVPFCWSCAGGEGLPPKTEVPSIKPAGSPPAAHTAPAPRVTAAIVTAGSASRVKCRRAGCERGVLHIHLSTLGNCRRILAAGLLGLEPSVDRQPHWDRAAAMGNFGETLVVEHLRQNNNLWNVLDKQATLEFHDHGILYVGHPDGDIQHGDEVHNLEIKCLSNSRWSLFQDQGVEYAFPEYVAQSVGYMHWKTQRSTHFAVMSRDSGRIFETEYEPKDVLTAWRAYAARIEEVAPIIMAGELPGPDFDGAQFECIVCGYSGTCPARQERLPLRRPRAASNA